MTKTELIKEVAAKVELSQSKVKDVIEEALTIIYDSDVTTVKGFGTFKWRTRKPRRGRNPQTGESIVIPEKKKLCFSSRS